MNGTFRKSLWEAPAPRWARAAVEAHLERVRDDA